MRTFKLKLSLLASLFCAPINASIDTSQSVLNMKVKSDGIYRVTYEDIIDMNIDLAGVLIRNLAIYNNGDLIPVKIVSNNQDTFEVGSYIEYVGFGDDNLYQEGSIYSLVLQNGSFVQEKTVEYDENQQPQSEYSQIDFYNENKDYSFGAPIDDPWFERRILAIGSPANETIDFELDNLVANGNVQIEMNIWGGTDYLQSPDHHVIYTLNGNQLDNFWFDGIIADKRNYTIDASSLDSGTQTIDITLPQDTNTVADVIHLDSWKVIYPRAFVLNNKQIDYSYHMSLDDQNQGSDVVFFNGFETQSVNFSIKNASNENYSIYKVYENGEINSYTSEVKGNCSINATLECHLEFATENSDGYLFISAESELQKPELTVPVFLTDIKQLGQADYLIISHPDFMGDELNEFIELKEIDYDVIVVDVEQIYAQFGFNNISADSISGYIRYAKNNFGITNVLLVGGDTYDYKNYLGLNSVSFMPTIYVQTDSLITFAPADAKYADTDGDNIPDINIGRFPVRTVSELTNLIEKINNYTNKSYGLTSVFAADKFDVNNNYSFKNDAEFLIESLPQSWRDNIGIDSNSKAYIDDDGLAVAKSKITDKINQGVALTSFIGHSGPRDWSFSRMFSASDALLLNNSSSPTLVTQWGCWNTYFVSPQEDTMAHAFMLNQNGGAASVLGASTLTKAEHEKGLAELVLSNLTHHNMTLGDAVTKAKRDYVQINPDSLDVILGWNILGDPGLKL